MRVHHQPLAGNGVGALRQVTSLHFGQPGGRRALLQASLHADEIPAMLVAQHLRRRLSELEAACRLQGEILLLPACNPIGMGQQVWGRLQGRFELGSGQNFNRHYPSLADDAAERALATGGLGDEVARNTVLLRRALHQTLDAQPPGSELQALRQALLRLAIDADVVLDLHCDNEAVLHFYANPQYGEQAAALGRCLRAPIGLMAEESGDQPFDEAVSSIWPGLRARLGDRFPLPLSGFSATVEHRGEIDVAHGLAAQDAEGLLRFLALQGFIDGLEPAPAFETRLLPLAGCMPIKVAQSGLLVWSVPVGSEVVAGQRLGEVLDPLSGESAELCSPVDGLFFARELQRWAQAGQAVGKVAGSQALRSGKLLSA